jgi:hypothetical protein
MASRIGVLRANGEAFVKEGRLSTSWTTEYNLRSSGGGLRSTNSIESMISICRTTPATSPAGGTG